MRSPNQEIMTMRAVILIAGLGFCVAAATTASAQQPTQRTYTSTTSLTPNRDVILEIPELSVDSIGLTVSDVKAHVALDANAMNLVQLTAGVDVGIKKVQLGIVGVMAEAYLYVDLDNVAKIVNRVVQTLDRNPQILIQVLKTVDTAVTSITGQPPQPR
jgi:transcriptional accessory protein Tex/SPT6